MFKNFSKMQILSLATMALSGFAILIQDLGNIWGFQLFAEQVVDTCYTVLKVTSFIFGGSTLQKGIEAAKKNNEGSK